MRVRAQVEREVFHRRRVVHALVGVVHFHNVARTEQVAAQRQTWHRDGRQRRVRSAFERDRIHAPRLHVAQLFGNERLDGRKRHVGRHVFAGDIHQVVDVGNAFGRRQLFHDRLNDLLLGVFATRRAIAFRLAVAGVGERLFAVERLHSLFQINLVALFKAAVLVLLVEVDFDIHVHAAQRVHDMDERLEVHLGVVVDVDAKRLLDALHAVEGAVVAQMRQLVRSVFQSGIGHVAVARNRHRRHLVVLRIHHHENVDVAARVDRRIVPFVDAGHVDDKRLFGNVDVRRYRRDFALGLERLDRLGVLFNRLVLLAQQRDPVVRNEQAVDLAGQQLLVQLLVVVHVHVFNRGGLRVDVRHRRAGRKRVRVVRVADFLFGEILDGIQTGIGFREQVDLDHALSGGRDVVERHVRVVERVGAKSGRHDIQQQDDSIQRRFPAAAFSLDQQNEQNQNESEQDAGNAEHDLQFEHAQTI